MTNCHPNEPIFIVISHYISSTFSIPVYGTALLVLFLKCPKVFDTRYRNYLVAHIISGVSLEIHLSVFWRANAILPAPILCSFGLSSEYPAINLQIFILLVEFTGISALTILLHRMKAVILHADQDKFQNIPVYFRNVFYLFCILTIVSAFMTFPEINNQNDYKLKMEQKFGTFPSYFWCQSCFFLVLDSFSFIFFLVSAYITVMAGFFTAAFTAFVTYRILHSSTLRLSRKTASMQKNVLSSLTAAFMVHVIFIIIPLLAYFSANFITIDNIYVSYICFLCVQEHGSISTLTLLITNKLLRKSAKQLLCIPCGHLKRPNGTVFNIAAHGNSSEA